MQKRRKSSREIKEYDQKFLLVVLLFVNQNAAILESSGSRVYDKHSCRYTEHSCKQLLGDVLSAPLLQQKTTIHSARETKSGLWSSASQSDTTLLGRVRGDAQPADLLVGLKVRGTEFLGRERSMQEGDVRRSVPPRVIKEPALLPLQHHLQNTSPIPNELNFKNKRKPFLPQSTCYVLRMCCSLSKSFSS